MQNLDERALDLIERDLDLRERELDIRERELAIRETKVSESTDRQEAALLKIADAVNRGTGS